MYITLPIIPYLLLFTAGIDAVLGCIISGYPVGSDTIDNPELGLCVVLQIISLMEIL